MFRDRIDAGQQLARRLQHVPADAIVVGLPRGGVPVAAEVARALGLELDVIVVRKLGVPWLPEVAFGAIGEGGVCVIDREVVEMAGLSEVAVAEVLRAEEAELRRRAERFRRGGRRLSLAGREVVVVDDGIATGSTARAACQVAHASGARRIVLAAPVAPPDWTDRLGGVADELVCVETPADYFAVGQCYRDFRPTTDEEVVACLRDLSGAAAADPPPRDREVTIALGDTSLHGQLTVPDDAVGAVIFAHGSGSSRFSSRNRFVATRLNQAGFATLLFDLLTVDEERKRTNVFDVALLAERLRGATEWARTQPELEGLPVGYFGASTGAAAALGVAASHPGTVSAVFSRGGRPDLAGTSLRSVRVPVLLVVGSRDPTVLELNRLAMRDMGDVAELAVVPGASHLFDEPGTLEFVAELAASWFGVHLLHEVDDEPPQRIYGTASVEGDRVPALVPTSAGDPPDVLDGQGRR